MKLILKAALFCLLATSCFGTIALRQNIGEAGTAGMGSSFSATSHYASTTLSGSLLLCVVAGQSFDFSAPPAPVVQSPSTPGFAWTLVSADTTGTATKTGSFWSMEVMAIYAITNASAMGTSIITTVTLTSGGSTNLASGFKLFEYSGFPSTTIAGYQGMGVGGTVGVGSITAGVNPSLIFVGCADFNGGSDLNPAGSGFSIVSVGGSAPFSFLPEEILNASPNIYAANFGGSITTNWACAALIAGSGGASGVQRHPTWIF